FRVERRDGGLAHLVMDHPARKLNVLDADAVASLEAALTDLEAALPQGVLVLSGKPGSFIAGAGVDAIGALVDADEVHALGRHAEKLGLVARAVPGAWLLERAEAHVAKLAQTPRRSRRAGVKRRDRFQPRGLMAWALSRTPFGRSLVFGQARKGVLARTAGVY